MLEKRKVCEIGVRSYKITLSTNKK